MKSKMLISLILFLILALSGCGNKKAKNYSEISADTINDVDYSNSNDEILDNALEPSESPSTESSSENIPIEIISHRFEGAEVYSHQEVQLFIVFNRPLTEEELGSPTTPIYTYKYSLSTTDGEDFVVDYGNGNSLSSVFFSKDYSEYKIANSGNGMREGKYVSDPLFTQENIESIRIVLYKKVNDDKYNHDYEVVDEYIYPINE